MRKEWLARILVISLLAAALAIPLLGWRGGAQGILVHARMAETGGWTPENLTAVVGQPLNLRLTSDDVTHSFAIGQSDQSPVDIHPGELTEITLVFDKPGKYTFYCTRWCSINHWRMRGVIEVTAPPGQEVTPEAVDLPLYVSLGLDIDAEHVTEAIPLQTPSAERGAAYEQMLPYQNLGREVYLTRTPAESWLALRAEPALQQLSDQAIWDLVAWVWQKNTTSQELSTGQQLYATNCAACHGEQGRGDGVFADELAQPDTDKHDGMSVGSMTTRPTDFTDAAHMLAASPAHLQGKIIRGGMGTGMPYWGPILTEEETWALVAYLWTFQFETE